MPDFAILGGQRPPTFVHNAGIHIGCAALRSHVQSPIRNLLHNEFQIYHARPVTLRIPNACLASLHKGDWNF
jgi:hypothetical protein